MSKLYALWDITAKPHKILMYVSSQIKDKMEENWGLMEHSKGKYIFKLVEENEVQTA